MWVARNGSIASGCECDKAKWQDCSGRKAVVLPYQRGAVFSLSRNGSRHGKSTMVGKAQAEYSCTQECPPVGTSLHVLFNYSEGEVRARAIVRNLATSRGMGLAIVSMEQEHRARLDRLLQRLAAE